MEVKRSLAPALEKGFRQACADLQPQRAFVVYADEERYPLAPGIEAIGLRALAEFLGAMRANWGT
ncbi:MAG: hypothetical protein RMN24_03395 [Anaerolineae bacterium]|nr:hypothetical protein [Caldilineales bacterium]MCX7853409.1 hypothetical protein [Caldilineales bacterium]MDW8268189.1 hypothetical protein [Anaerolineae bacterium]